MILKIQHSHEAKMQKDAYVRKTDSLHQSDPLHQKHWEFLRDLLNQSQKVLSQKSKNDINQMKHYRQKKAYQTLAPNQNNYLAVMLEKANSSQKSYIQELMGSREDSILRRIAKSQFEIRQQEKNDKKIKRIKNQLNDKIKQMKQQLGDFANGKDETYKQSIYQTKMNNSLVLLQDFKKKQYWKDKSFNQEGEKVKSFISKMKKQKSQLEGKFNQDLQNRFKKLDELNEVEKQKSKQQKYKQYMNNLQKQYRQKSNQRKQYYQEKKNKNKEIQTFLQNLNSKQPIHVKFQKDFKDFIVKQQEIRQKVLRQIKQKHPHYNPQQIEQHANEYMQKKQKYQEQKQIKAEMEQQILSKRYQQIQQLFHSKFHKDIADNKKVKDINHQSLTNNRKKVIEYAKTVKQTFKPLIDKRKRKEVSDTIRILQLSNDPTKKKIIKGNGIVDFQDKRQTDSYQKGVSYLEQLRSLNEINKSKISSSQRYEQRSNSALQLTKSTTKKIDYLRQSRPSLQLKPTISDWKDLLAKKQFSTKDKLQRVLDRAQTLQIHAKQKQVQLRNMRKQDNALEIKQESDKYYLESVAARMVLLKDVIMK